MMNCMKRFEAMISELENHPRINIIKNNSYPAINEEKIAEIEEDFAIKLDYSVSNFYQQVGGLELEWSADLEEDEAQLQGADQIIGSIHLLPLERVFAGWNDDEWFNDLWFGWMDEAQSEPFKRLKPLDYFDGQDSGCVCFQRENGRLNSKLKYHSVDYGINELRSDFSTYIDLLLDTRGYFRWQLLIVTDKTIDGYKAQYDQFSALMPKLFPKTDFSKLR
ncbi:hypothetical protein [Leptolyngbya sp. FACHB-17]|uniref:hypothetical protein n=1 Tax=unclassified Leptolyngbya TaxID=2650499 RepID=UPI0016806C42|nr:hypothetical protein [Leptolyngbya sp. FACHB-17]MBD2080956.1 hypothetical protein [Leptolyngbya sp. FACHB-17]